MLWNLLAAIVIKAISYWTFFSRVEILKFLVIMVSSPESALLKSNALVLLKGHKQWFLSKPELRTKIWVKRACQFYRKIGPLFPISFFSGKLSLSTPLSSTRRSCNSTNSRNLRLIFQKISAIWTRISYQVTFSSLIASGTVQINNS